MSEEEHVCIQERRLERLEKKTDKMDDKYEKILNMLSDNKSTLKEILTRLDKKKEDDRERNGAIQKEDERLDNVEKEQVKIKTAFNSQKELMDTVVLLLKGIAVGLAIFMGTFFIKTFIWGF